MKSNLKAESVLLKLSLVAGFVIAGLEFLFSYLTKSQALFVDGIFSVAEVIVGLIFIILLPLIYKPATERRPYGYTQLENVFLIIKSSALIVITLGLIKDNIFIILNGGNETNSLLIGIFEIIACIMCIVIIRILSNGKKEGMTAPVLDAEILTWKMYLYSCIGIGIAFLIQLIIANTKLAFGCKFIDPIVAIAMAMVMLPELMKILCNSSKNIVLLTPNNDIKNWIKKVTEKQIKDDSLTVTYYECVQTGRQIWVNVYIKKENEMVNIEKIKKFRENLLNEMHKKVQNVSLEISLDLDP